MECWCNYVHFVSNFAHHSKLILLRLCGFPPFYDENTAALCK